MKCRFRTATICRSRCNRCWWLIWLRYCLCYCINCFHSCTRFFKLSAILICFLGIKFFGLSFHSLLSLFILPKFVSQKHFIMKICPHSNVNISKILIGDFSFLFISLDHNFPPLNIASAALLYNIDNCPFSLSLSPWNDCIFEVISPYSL